MSVTVLRNFGPLVQLELTNKQLMREVGLMARERIVRRTLSGHQVSGALFKPYSEGYRIQKTEALGSASPVNLQASGRMLQAITILNVTDASVELGFKD